MSGYVRLSRVSRGRYSWRDYQIRWIKCEGERGCWQLTNRNGLNWITNCDTLQEIRDYLVGGQA